MTLIFYQMEDGKSALGLAHHDKYCILPLFE